MEEAADYLARAREFLTEAEAIASLPLPKLAARHAYYAAFHAAQAYILERTGKIAKTHRGVHNEFARLARCDDRIGGELVHFLAAAYRHKQDADYAVGTRAAHLSEPEARAALLTANRLVNTITRLLAA